MTIRERDQRMDDLAGPTGLLKGMTQPRAWVESLTGRIPQASVTTGRLPTGLWAVRLTLAVAGLTPMQVVLVPYPDQVRMTLWTSVWAATPSPQEAQWLALMTLARHLIGIARQEDPSVVVLLLPPTHVHDAWMDEGP